MIDNRKGKSEHENKYFTTSVMELMEEKQGRRERNCLGKQTLQKVSDHTQVKQYSIPSNKLKEDDENQKKFRLQMGQDRLSFGNSFLK